MPDFDVRDEFIKKLLEDNKEQKAMIERLEKSIRVMKVALADIAAFNWIAWSVDYSPKQMATDALKKA